MPEGKHNAPWDVDPGLLNPGAVHGIAFIVDGGPNIISVVADGTLCDGKMLRQWGFGRFVPGLGAIGRGTPMAIHEFVKSLSIYDRHLRANEAVGNHGVAGVG